MTRNAYAGSGNIPLIDALIRLALPQTIVAIGAGDSRLMLTAALQQAQLDWQRDSDMLRTHYRQAQTMLLDPSAIPNTYQPQLITLEEAPTESVWHAGQVPAGDEGLITFVQQELATVDSETIGSWGPIDLVWIDAGTLADQVRFVSMLWEPIVAGGYLCLHEPTLTTALSIDGAQQEQSRRSPLWEEIFFRLDDSYEAITLPEHHKHRHGGLGIMRKRLDSERTIRSTALQAELIALGEVPIRNDLLPFGWKQMGSRTQRNSVTVAMSSPVLRTVYAAVVLGAKKISEILEQTKMDSKTVNKSIIRLLSLGLIQRDVQGFHDVGSIWAEISTPRHRDTENLSDRKLESAVMLERIATAFHHEVRYSESEVSKICKLFTVDFARLRRCLVDSGILQRENNSYQRTRQ